MRLWVPHDERRPQPEPAETNDALAFAVGLALWSLALIIVLVAPFVWPTTEGMLPPPPLADHSRALTTVLLALAFGTLGLLVSVRRTRARR